MVQPTEPTSRKESPSALNHSSGTTFSSLVTKPPTKEVLKAEQVCLRIHSGSFPKQELTSRGTGLFKKAQHIVEQAITQRPRNLLAWPFFFYTYLLYLPRAPGTSLSIPNVPSATLMMP